VYSAELRQNLDNIRKRAGSAVIYAVLNGNGYCLGLIPIAVACRDAGITRYAVTDVSDVAVLRQCGYPDDEILMLRPTVDTGEVRLLLALNALIPSRARMTPSTSTAYPHLRMLSPMGIIKIDTWIRAAQAYLPEEDWPNFCSD
jgi:Alanine racemase